MAVLQTPWYDKAVEALKLNGKSERTQLVLIIDLLNLKINVFRVSAQP